MTSSAGGGFGAIVSQLQHLQDQIAGAGSDEEIAGTAAGGAVTVRVRGDLEFTSVSIDPAVVDPGDVATLEDLVLVAVRDAVSRLQRERQTAIGQVMGGALSGLFGALGEAVDEAWDEDDEEDEDEDDGEDDDDAGATAARGALEGPSPAGGGSQAPPAPSAGPDEPGPVGG